MTDINKKLCQHLGICWHEYPLTGRCACIKCGYSGSDVNPDFTRDPLALLREMMKREDWNAFKTAVVHSLDDFLSLITDTSGALAKAAAEWFRGRENE